MLPKDPFILLSYLNTQLRDRGLTPEEFAREEDLDLAALEETLAAAGFSYDPASGRYR